MLTGENLKKIQDKAASESASKLQALDMTPTASVEETTDTYVDPCTLDSTPVNASEACNMLATAEGNGEYTEYNSDTGAAGRYQFMPSTGKSVLKQLGFSSAEADATWEECKKSSSSKCKAIQDSMCNHYSGWVQSQLEKKNIPLTTENMYLAWNQGTGGANAILRSIQTGMPVTNPKILRNMKGQAWAFSDDGATFYKNMRGYLQGQGVALA